MQSRRVCAKCAHLNEKTLACTIGMRAGYCKPKWCGRDVYNKRIEKARRSWRGFARCLATGKEERFVKVCHKLGELSYEDGDFYHMENGEKLPSIIFLNEYKVL